MNAENKRERKKCVYVDAYMYVCMCVCMCERKKERERKKQKKRFIKMKKKIINKNSIPDEGNELVSNVYTLS